MKKEMIRIKGARENNLKNIDLEVPRKPVCCIYRAEWFWKSSLAFDTIYAEGQKKIHGIFIFLCKTVLGADGETGCRQHRGIIACDFY